MKPSVNAGGASYLRVVMIAAIAIASLHTQAIAQWHGSMVPDSIAFQGFITKSGVPLDSTFNIPITMYKDGSPVWSNTFTNVAVTAGVFDVVLAGASLDTVAFNTPIQLGIQIGQSELSPQTSFTSSPYALALRGLHAVPASQTVPAVRSGMNLIGGGTINFVAADVVGATIGGGGGVESGVERPDSVLGHWGTVSGGISNTAGGFESTVGGGYANKARGERSTAGGGFNNRARGDNSTIAGGADNQADGNFATVPGGQLNEATGIGSFAAGTQSRAMHDGVFAWSDFNGSGVTSTAANQFLINAAGGVGIGTNSPEGQLHVSAGNSGDAVLAIEADADNNNEDDNPGIQFLQDATQTGMFVGFDDDRFGANIFGFKRRTLNTEYLWPDLAIQTSTGFVQVGSTGAASPTNQLHVIDRIDAGATIAGHVALIENDALTYASGPDVLALRSSTPGASMSNTTNYITFFEGGGAAIGSIEGAGGPGISLNTSSADFAEYVPKKDVSEEFEPGQVIGLDAYGASLATHNAHRILVVTKAPAVVGNRPVDGNEGAFVKAALVGQVDVYLDGPAHAGDYILASGLNDGKAVAKSPSSMRVDDLDGLIGRAWESKQPGSDQVHIEVGLDLTAVMKEIMRRQDERIGRLEEVVAELERRTTN